MIQQFTYTASPWGKTGAGWMVFQQSRNVPPDAAKALYPVYRYEGDPNSPDAARTSVQFAYLPADSDDGAVLAQTTFTGTRWFDPRPGDFFAHVLLLDKDAVLRSATSGINPVRLFLSPGLQTAFPDALKEKALQIYRKDIAWEPPPELPELSSLAELPTNPILSFEAIVRSLPDKVVPKLGAILRSVLLRTIGKGDAPVVFDAKNADSAAIMVLVLDLLPPTWRARTWCAVRFRESALRRLPAFSSLSFYGTDTDKPSDSDTGIVSGVDFSQNPFQFTSNLDVSSFKRQLDCLGKDVSVDDYRGLVSCWEVAAGRAVDLEKVRAAAKFAERFPCMKDKVASGLAGAFSDYNHDHLPEAMKIVGVVVGYELGFDLFRSDIPGTLDDFIRDSGLFSEALRVLNGDAARTAFLDAVFDAARDASALAALAKMLRSCDDEARQVIGAVAPSGRLSKFAACADRMMGLSQNVSKGLVPAKDAGGALDEIEAAENEFGSVFGDMGEVRNGLRYLVALDGLKGPGGLQAFADVVHSLGVADAKVRDDVLERVKPGDIPVEQLAETMGAFEVVGVPMVEVLRLAVKTAEARGRSDGVRSGRRQAQEAEDRARRYERQKGVPLWLAVVMSVGMLALGLSAGMAIGSLRGSGRARIEKPDRPSWRREKPSLPELQKSESGRQGPLQESLRMPEAASARQPPAEWPQAQGREPEQERPQTQGVLPELERELPPAPTPKSEQSSAPISSQAPALEPDLYPEMVRESASIPRQTPVTEPERPQMPRQAGQDRPAPRRKEPMQERCEW